MIFEKYIAKQWNGKDACTPVQTGLEFHFSLIKTESGENCDGKGRDIVLSPGFRMHYIEQKHLFDCSGFKRTSFQEKVLEIMGITVTAMYGIIPLILADEISSILQIKEKKGNCKVFRGWVKCIWDQAHLKWTWHFPAGVHKNEDSWCTWKFSVGSTALSLCYTRYFHWIIPALKKPNFSYSSRNLSELLL